MTQDSPYIFDDDQVTREQQPVITEEFLDENFGGLLDFDLDDPTTYYPNN